MHTKLCVQILKLLSKGSTKWKNKIFIILLISHNTVGNQTGVSEEFVHGAYYEQTKNKTKLTMAHIVAMSLQQGRHFLTLAQSGVP